MDIQPYFEFRGFTTVRFKAFLLESRDPEAPFHNQAKRYETNVLDVRFHPGDAAIQAKFVAAAKAVEQAYKQWQEADDE